METKRDLFDIMQDYIPPEDLFLDDCEKVDVERCKLRVLRKKGAGFMRRRILKRVAAACLALVLVTCTAAGVDAATGGHIRKKIIETITLENNEKAKLEVEAPEGAEIKTNKSKDGSVSVDIDNVSEEPVSISIMETSQPETKEK